VAAPSKNAAKPPLKGADGVVSGGECCGNAFAKHFITTDHPVTPPVPGGEHPHLRINIMLKSMTHRFAFAALLLPLFTTTLAGADKTVSREFITEPPTLISLGFEWEIEGDDNRNADAGDPKL
jgi:hypothetical protein